MNSYNPFILCYHRIDCEDLNQMGISPVSPTNFEAQMKYISENFNVVSLEEIHTRRQNNTVALTFDDGYLDNLNNAAEILIKYDLPATFFISSFYCSNELYFYHDIVPLLSDADLDKFEINNDSFISMNFYQKILYFSKLDLEFIEYKLKEINDFAISTKLARILPKVMNLEQVKELDRQYNFSIGTHTHFHSNLNTNNLDNSKLDYELGVKWLKENFSDYSRFFPFPFGQPTDMSQDLIKYVFDTHGMLSMSTSPFNLTSKSDTINPVPRISVQNWSIIQFKFVLSSVPLISVFPSSFNSLNNIRKKIKFYF